MTDRKKPGVAFWATVALVAVLVAYPLSFGPACWLVDWGFLNSKFMSITYRPIFMIVLRAPSPVARGINRYMRLFAIGYWVFLDGTAEFVDWRGNVGGSAPNTFK